MIHTIDRIENIEKGINIRDPGGKRACSFVSSFVSSFVAVFKNERKIPRIDKLLWLSRTEFSPSPTTSSLSGHVVPAKWFAKGEQPVRSRIDRIERIDRI